MDHQNRVSRNRDGSSGGEIRTGSTGVRRREQLRRDAGLALLASAMALAAPALLRSRASPRATADIIAPSDPHAPTVDSGWQAGTCNEEPPPKAADFCSVAHPRPILRRRRRPPELRLHPVHRRSTRRRACSEASNSRSANWTTSGSSSRSGSASTRAPPSAARSRPSKRAPAAARHGSKVGEAASPPRPPLLVPIRPPGRSPRSPSTTSIPPARAGGPLRPRTRRQRSLPRRRLDWAGDYHEGFTIAVPHALPIPRDRRPDPEEPPRLRRPRRRRHLHHHAEHLPRRSLHRIGQRLLDPACAPPPTRKRREPGYTFPASAGAALESPIPPGTSPKECNTIPYAPTHRRRPGHGGDRLARRRRGRRSTSRTSPAPTDRTAPTPARRQVTLPAGMGINPAAANGLKTCTDAQFGKGHREPGRLPGRLADRHARRSPRRRCPKATSKAPVYVGRAAQPRPDLRRRVPDLRRRRVGPLRDLGAAARRRPRRPGHRPADDDVRRKPAGPVHLLQARLRPRRPRRCSAARRPAARTDRDRDDALVGQPAGDPRRQLHAPGRPRRRRLRGRAWRRAPSPPASAVGPKSAHAGAFSPLALTISRRDGQQELKGADVTLAPGMTGKLAGIPYCPAAALAAAATPAPAARGGELELPGDEPARHRDRRGRHRPRAAADRRQGLPLRPLPRGPSLPGSAHPRHGRAVRPRHGRGEGGAVRRPGNGPGPRRLRPDPRRLRRHPAEHPLGRVDLDRERFTLNPTSCDAARQRRRPRRRRRRPGRPGGLQLVPGRGPLPDLRLPARSASARSSTPASSAAARRPGAPATRSSARSSSPATATPTSAAPRSPCRTRSSSTRATSARLHAATAGRARLPAALDLRLRAGAHAAARRRTRRPGLPGLLATTCCPTCSPTCTARSTSACAA